MCIYLDLYSTYLYQAQSKHMLNVFKDARAAYQERKAEIVAAREVTSRNNIAPRIRRAYTVDDTSVSSSRRSDRSRHNHRESHHGERSHERGVGITRRHSDSRSRSEAHTKPKVRRTSTTPINSVNSPSSASMSSPMTLLPPYSAEYPRPLTRNRTFHEETPRSPGHLISPRRTRSSDGIDMDLAYGDPPYDLMHTGKRRDELELSGLVGRAKFLLDEAKCVQHSVQSTLANLQKNPEAMAAVALILGEISTVVKRMSPGALAKIRVLAPSVFALLTSPQFLIAAGVGVGVTIIALGGYKIIKKIKAKKEEEETPEHMIALGSEVSRIETWRQGISDAETASIGTSVDGEFITPMAANLSRLNLAEERAESLRHPKARSSCQKGSKSPTVIRPRSSRALSSKDTGRSTGSSTIKESKSSRTTDRESRPKPSPLRSLFKP